jgi:hypothetical protein
MRVDEGVPARDAHAVALSESSEYIELGADLLETLVPRVFDIPIAAFAAQVTLAGRLEPGNAVVGIIPGQTIVSERVKVRGHERILS